MHPRATGAAKLDRPTALQEKENNTPRSAVAGPFTHPSNVRLCRRRDAPPTGDGPARNRIGRGRRTGGFRAVSLRRCRRNTQTRPGEWFWPQRLQPGGKRKKLVAPPSFGGQHITMTARRRGPRSADTGSVRRDAASASFRENRVAKLARGRDFRRRNHLSHTARAAGADEACPAEKCVFPAWRQREPASSGMQNEPPEQMNFEKN